ncbi:MAG: cadherin-like beta sandwich domain-containing protein, partial [Bacteroidota bacterium]
MSSLKYSICLLLFTTLPVLAASAQCIDEQFTTATLTDNDFGQSFTIPVGGCGALTNLVLERRNGLSGNLASLTATFELFAGETISGTPLYTQTGINISSGTGDKTITLGGGTGSLAVSPNTQYTWYLTFSVNADWRIGQGSSGDSYAGGRSYLLGSFQSNFDVDMTINSTTPNAPCTTVATATELLTWTGAKSTAWDDACNWSPNGIPTATNDVTIPSAPTNQPTLSVNTALAKSVEVQSGATFTIASTGQLTINDSKGFMVPNTVTTETTAFRNQGTIENNGRIILGSTSSIGQYGIWNTSVFNNNTGGEIAIDNSTSVGLYNLSGTFANSAKITIGANESVGADGLENRATFNNNTGGEIAIDNSTSRGLHNKSGTFINAAKITIGANVSVGSTGLENSANFNNNTGGEISIGRSSSQGIYNLSGTFNNSARITIGAIASVGQSGLLNWSTFNNNSCAVVTIMNGELSALSIGSYNNAGYTFVANELYGGASNLSGGFTNNGVLKYATTTGKAITNTANSSVIINNHPTPIFTYGGTYNGTINGIFTDDAATTSAGTLAAPNTFTPSSALPSGSQTLYVSITQNGCSAPHIVPFTYNNPLSSNADLNALTLSAGTLNPTFASGTTAYTATVNNVPTSVTVTPTVADANATVTVNGTAVTSGTASSAINLNVGSNTLTIEVTAEDGTKKTYMLTVTRSATCTAVATTTELLTWTGAKSTAWNEACNWSPIGVPTATNDVTIPSAPINQPTLSVNTAVAKSVEVQSGATLTIATMGQLTINDSKGFTVSSLTLTSAFLNQGTVENNGKLVIGNIASAGDYGILNFNIFNNNMGSETSIDNTAVGIYNQFSGMLTNAAKISLGTNASPVRGIINNGTINNTTGGEITVDNVSDMGIFNAGGTITNTAKIIFGATASGGNRGIFMNSAAVINNNTGGEIKIDNTVDVGLDIIGGTFNNLAKVVIGSNTSVGATGLSVGTGVTFNNNTGGEITVNRTTTRGIYNQSNAFTNAGKITIGANASVGNIGFENFSGVIDNTMGSELHIDNSASIGLKNTGGGLFKNSGKVIIGANSSVGGTGIENLFATFDNKTGGEITIDRSTSTGFYNNPGQFNTATNSGKITIGANASVGSNGIQNEATFSNNTGGEISIDNSALAGILNNGSATFTNVAKINIGANTTAGVDGIENRGTFHNNAGGDMAINNTSTRGVSNSGTFNNLAKLFIGTDASVGIQGLNNTKDFNNKGSGVLKIDNATNFGILNVFAGNLVNESIITIGENTASMDKGIQNRSMFQNNACGQLFVKHGILENSSLGSDAKTYINEGFTFVADTLNNETTFTNNGILKYGGARGNAVANATNSSVIVNNHPTPIFTFGSTFDGTINGIFMDATATTSAGMFTAPNTFTPIGSLPIGSQTLYAKITQNGCSEAHIVPFIFVIAAPEISITGNGQDIINGADLAAATTANGTDFANVCVAGGTQIITYTITNTGNADLTLGGTPIVVLGNATDFSVTTQPTSPVSSASGANTTTFTIKFDPTTAGVKSSTVSMATNDRDENPFSFIIKGTGDENPVVNAGADINQCANGTFTMSASTPTIGTGNWTLINGVATITTPSSSTTSVTGVGAGGSATLRWTVTNGTCSSFDEVVLNNKALPTATATATSATCQAGTTKANSDGKINVANFAASDKYQFSVGNTFDVNNATPSSPSTIPTNGEIANNLANANQSYTVRITNADGCTIDRVVSLTATSCSCTNPVLSDLMNETICVGGSFTSANVTTSVTNSVAVNYQWYNDNGTNNNNANAINGQTTATLTALPTTAGIYKYRVEATRTDDSSCQASKMVTLVINALPTAVLTSSDPDNTIFLGEQVTFTASGGNNYEFFVNNQSMQSGVNSTFTTTALSWPRSSALGQMSLQSWTVS